VTWRDLTTNDERLPGQMKQRAGEKPVNIEGAPPLLCFSGLVACGKPVASAHSLRPASVWLAGSNLRAASSADSNLNSILPFSTGDESSSSANMRSVQFNFHPSNTIHIPCVARL
jgi:hypothetical protein